MQPLQEAGGIAPPSEAAAAAAVRPGPGGASAAGVCDPSTLLGRGAAAAEPVVSGAEPREVRCTWSAHMIMRTNLSDWHLLKCSIP